MLEKGRITYKQLILMIVVSRIIVTITYLPAISEPPANQDIWLSELIFFPLQLLFAAPVYLLWKRFPDQTIIEYSQTIAGKKLGKLVSIFFIGYFLNYTAIALAQFSIFLTTAIMPETPFLFFILTLALVSAYAIHKGLEVIGRLAEFFAPLILFAIISIFILLVKDMDLKSLTPVMEKGMIPILQGGTIYSARSLEVLGLAMLLSYLNERRKVKAIFIISFALISLFFVIITLPVLMVLGLQEAKTATFPFFSAIRLINLGDFIERIEAFHMAIWILGIFLKVSLYYYLTVLGLGQLFNLKDYKPVILPLGTIIIPLTILISPSLVELQEFTTYKIFAWYSSFHILLLPSLLLLIAIIRKKGVRSK